MSRTPPCQLATASKFRDAGGAASTAPPALPNTGGLVLNADSDELR